MLHGAAPGRMAAEESPEPRDIYWFNTGISKKSRNRRRYLVEAFLLLLYVFYVIPVTLLYLVLSVDAVTSYATWIAELYLEVGDFVFSDFVSCRFFLVGMRNSGIHMLVLVSLFSAVLVFPFRIAGSTGWDITCTVSCRTLVGVGLFSSDACAARWPRVPLGSWK